MKYGLIEHMHNVLWCLNALCQILKVLYRKHESPRSSGEFTDNSTWLLVTFLLLLCLTCNGDARSDSSPFLTWFDLSSIIPPLRSASGTPLSQKSRTGLRGQSRTWLICQCCPNFSMPPLSPSPHCHANSSTNENVSVMEAMAKQPLQLILLIDVPSGQAWQLHHSFDRKREKMHG